MKPSVLIGSSTEGLPAAKVFQAGLQTEAEVTVWDQGTIFAPSAGTLDSLLRCMERFDFAVFVFTADDLVESRGSATFAPRDNVVFELGMCFGRLGPRRTFAACQADEHIKVPSDLAGVTLPRFDPKKDGGDLAVAVAPVCEQILQAIRKHAEQSELRLLPSTALAIGYFENFLKPVLTSGTLQFNGRSWTLAQDDLKFIILIPDEFGATFHPNLPSILRDQSFRQVTVNSPSRDFPFYVRAEVEDGVLELYDIPTTLSVVPLAVRLHLGKQCVGLDPEEHFLQQREAQNFRRALQRLLEAPEHLRLRRVVEIRDLPSR